ncbi:MAG: glycosyltransferase family 4 protein [Pseudomonadota bacterium]
MKRSTPTSVTLLMASKSAAKLGALSKAKPLRPAKGLTVSTDITLPRTCIVSGEFVGLFRNGGLGTSMTGLAELLAACGAEVTVLYTGDIGDDVDEHVEKYRAAGIRLEILARLQTQPIAGRLEEIYKQTNAWRVFNWLKTQEFDVIHFNDTMGEGVCSIMAKRMGMAFQNTLINLAIHSPTQWILHANRHAADWLGFACFTGNERVCIKHTDVLWGPSLYLLDWLVENDYELPKQVVNQQYVVPTTALFEPGVEKLHQPAPDTLPSITPKEIVFFGRLEERKGIRLFVAALSRIAPLLKERGIGVVFMGKPSSVGGQMADEWIASKSAQWDFDWRIESDFGQREAVAFLKSNDRLAVMASPIDNSPCTVYEAMQHAIPFIASTGGGIPELIHPDDRERHLFDYTIGSLGDCLTNAIEGGISAARPAYSIEEHQKRWLTFHRDWKKYLPKGTAQKSKTAPRFAALLDHAGSQKDFRRCLATLQNELDVAQKDIAVLWRDGAEGSADGFEGTIIDRDSDQTTANMLSTFVEQGAAGLICMRTSASVIQGSAAHFNALIGSGIDAWNGQALVGDNEQLFVGYGTSAAYCAYEGSQDSGIFVADLNSASIPGALLHLDSDRQFSGLAEEMLAQGAMVAPCPVALVRHDHIDGTIARKEGAQRRFQALSKADHHSNYIAMVVGQKMYTLTMGGAFATAKKVVKAVVESVESQPAVGGMVSRAKGMAKRFLK